MNFLKVDDLTANESKTVDLDNCGKIRIKIKGTGTVYYVVNRSTDPNPETAYAIDGGDSISYEDGKLLETITFLTSDSEMSFVISVERYGQGFN